MFAAEKGHAASQLGSSVIASQSRCAVKNGLLVQLGKKIADKSNRAGQLWTFLRQSFQLFEGGRHLYEIEIGASAPVRVELPSVGESRIFRLGDRVRVEVSSDTVVLVPAS